MRPPNKISTKFLDLEWSEMWSGMNGQTNFYKTVLGRKRQKILFFQRLTYLEFEMLLEYKDNGFWLVEYAEQQLGFSGQYIISFDGCADTFAAGQGEITLTLTPLIVET